MKRAPARQVGDRVEPSDATIAVVLEVAKADPVVHALVDEAVRRPAFFGMRDLQLYPAVFLRGRKREAWNAGDRVVGPRDVPLAKNGAGDLFVWNADTGSVRFLVHDEGWQAKGTYASLDDFLEEELYRALEQLQEEDLEPIDEFERAAIALAVQIVGDEVDEELRARLEEAGIVQA